MYYCHNVVYQIIQSEEKAASSPPFQFQISALPRTHLVYLYYASQVTFVAISSPHGTFGIGPLEETSTQQCLLVLTPYNTSDLECSHHN